MASHSCTLSWKILWMEEPGRGAQDEHRKRKKGLKEGRTVGDEKHISEFFL